MHPETSDLHTRRIVSEAGESFADLAKSPALGRYLSEDRKICGNLPWIPRRRDCAHPRPGPHLGGVRPMRRTFAQTLGDNLDPSLVHHLKPLSLMLGILVRDGADEVMALPGCVPHVRMRVNDDLVHQHLGERALINSR
jgi:hypothetical protein